MAQWYYSEGPNRNVGPLSVQEIGDRFRQGILLLDTYVWREGMAQWRPLRDVAAELGLTSTPDSASNGAQPPPLPAAASLHRHAAPHRTSVATPRGLSRGVIVLIICAVAIIPVLAVLGILAGIAVPAYHGYTLKARAAEPIAAGTALKPQLARHMAEHGACPRNGEGEFQSPESYAARYVEAITVGPFDDGTCGIEIRVRGTGQERLDHHAIWLTLDPRTQQWSCTSDIEDRFLPAPCRG